MKKYALVVGISKYDDADIVDLPLVSRDAAEMRRSLEKDCEFDVVRLLGSKDGKERVYKSDIARELGNLADDVESGDTFLFYFAGHGTQSEGRSRLLTSDTVLRMKDWALSVEKLKASLGRVNCSQKVLIFDCCRGDPQHSRGERRGSAAEGFVRDIKTLSETDGETASTTCVMFSCSEGERSYEWPEKGHGVFTHFLLEGFQKERDEEGQLTIQNMARYVTDGVLDWSRKRHQQQTPWMESSGLNVDDVVLIQKPVGGSIQAKDLAGKVSGDSEIVIDIERTRRAKSEKKAEEATAFAEEEKKKRAAVEQRLAEEKRKVSGLERELQRKTQKIQEAPQRAGEEWKQAEADLKRVREQLRKAKVAAKKTSSSIEATYRGSSSRASPEFDWETFWECLGCLALIILALVIYYWVMVPLGTWWDSLWSGGGSGQVMKQLSVPEGTDSSGNHDEQAPPSLDCRHTIAEVKRVVWEVVRKQYRKWGEDNDLPPIRLELEIKRVEELTNSAWSEYEQEITAACPKCSRHSKAKLEEKDLLSSLTRWTLTRGKSDLEAPDKADSSVPGQQEGTSSDASAPWDPEVNNPARSKNRGSLTEDDSQSEKDIVLGTDASGESAKGVTKNLESGTFIRGDVNDDGKVDFYDAVQFKKVLGELRPGSGTDFLSCPDRYDVNDDGRVNQLDHDWLYGYVYHPKIPANRIPPPWPSAGSDPTPDELFCSE